MKNSFITIKLNGLMRILLATLLLVCVAGVAHSSKFSKAKLVFTDGRIIEGFADIPKNPWDQSIRFRTDLKAKRETIPSSDLRRIVYYDGADSSIIEQIPHIRLIDRTRTNRPLWMIKLVEGYVSLYVFTEGAFTHVSPTGTMRSSGFYKFACIRRSEAAATIISTTAVRGTAINNNGMFRKEPAQYFEDYPELAAKIANKEYTYKDIVEVVNEYNKWKER